MKTALFSLALLIGSSSGLPAYQQSAGQDVKDAGTDTKNAAKSAGRATKKGATKSTHAVKKGVHKTATATEKGVGKVAGKTQDTTSK